MKSPNILVDGSGNIKLADFGLSKIRLHTMISGSVMTGGTAHWMAPEMIRSEKINEKADVFSFSIIIWELLTGKFYILNFIYI